MESPKSQLTSLLKRILALAQELRGTISKARSLRLKASDMEQRAFAMEANAGNSASNRTQAVELRAEAKRLREEAAEARVRYRNLYGELYYLKEDLLALGEDGQRLFDSMARIQFSSTSDVRGWLHPAHNFDEDGISMGSITLERILSTTLDTLSASTGTKLVRPFLMPEGSALADVQIRFTSDFEAQISVGRHTEVRTYIEMGFEDGRKGKQNPKPDQNWEALRAFAESGGIIGSTKEASQWGKIEKRVQTIDTRLKKLLGFSEKTIGYDRKAKAYKSKVRLIPPPSDEAP